jgi:hypothetical protein
VRGNGSPASGWAGRCLRRHDCLPFGWICQEGAPLVRGRSLSRTNTVAVSRPLIWPAMRSIPPSTKNRGPRMCRRAARGNKVLGLPVGAGLPVTDIRSPMARGGNCWPKNAFCSPWGLGVECFHCRCRSLVTYSENQHRRWRHEMTGHVIYKQRWAGPRLFHANRRELAVKV